MKRMVCALLVLMMALGCVSASATKLAWGIELECTPEMYSAIDLSEHKTINLLMMGDTPKDWPMVLEETNRRLEPFNTELAVTTLSWSDYGTMYPLIMAGGENVDIVYMATWAFLWDMAGEGYLKALDMDFIEKYMPMSYQYQDPASWMEVKYNGDIIGVCQGFCSAEPSLVAIRGDLREKYGLDPLTDYESFKQYLLTVAEHTEETGLIAYNTPASEGLLGDYIRDKQFYLNVNTRWRYAYKDGALPSNDEITFCYKLPEYREYLDVAKELNDAGVWSRSALSKTETLAQSYGNGQSGAMEWNFTVYQYMDIAEDIEGVKGEAYDLSGDMPFGTQPYNNSVLAIHVSSKDPERAAMLIDIMKWDFDINVLLMFGVEGYHFYSNGDSTYTLDEVNNDNYPPFGTAISWIINNGNWNESFANPAEAEMYDKVYAKAVGNVTNGFVMDNEPIINEKAAVESVIGEYRYTLGLGFFDDADAAYAEFMDAMEAAGLEAWETEFRSQYTAWYDVNNG